MANYYGWTLPAPDDRDLIYSCPIDVRALPSRVDLSFNRSLGFPFEPTWDQGGLGSCGPHAAGVDIVYSAMKQQGLINVPKPSPLFIYYCTRALMDTVSQDSGVNNRTMLKALAKYGWCDESRWPYQISKFKQKPSAEAFEQAATRKIIKYESVPQNLDTMRGALANGDPFVFGFFVYNSMETEAVERSGDIPMPTSRDRQVGGHDVLIVGYDDATQRFKIKNSWGGWGVGGYGTIPYEYAIHSRLAGDFWTVTHSQLPDSPTPTPTPSPTPPSPSPNVTEIDLGLMVGRVPSQTGGLISFHAKGFEADLRQYLSSSTGAITLNSDLRKALLGLRDFVSYVAGITPTAYDDEIVKWIDWILGDNSANQSTFRARMGIDLSSLPWEQIIKLILPLLISALRKWLEQVSANLSK